MVAGIHSPGIHPSYFTLHSGLLWLHRPVSQYPPPVSTHRHQGRFHRQLIS